MFLISRAVVQLAVDGPAGGSIDNLLDAHLQRAADDVKRTYDIGLCVEDWLIHRAAHVHLGGMMIDYLWSLSRKHLSDAVTIGDVNLIETSGRVQVFSPASGQVVNHRHLMSKL